MQVIIAYNDGWEQYSVIYQTNGINCENALQLFQAELENNPDSYEDYDGATAFVFDTQTRRVETINITKTIKVEVSF